MQGKGTAQYRKLDSDTISEITSCVIDRRREEAEKQDEARHDSRRANIKLLLRHYRDIAAYADNALYDAARIEYDLKLKDILALMTDRRKGSFRVSAIQENAVAARVMVDHMDRMLEFYRFSCEKCGEDMRRYRAVTALYTDPEPMSVDEVAEAEKVDKSTVYRDVDAACDKLAVLFFGAYGLRFL